jgi:hypothetical protein
MTLERLSRKISGLRPQVPITREFERELERRGMWSTDNWYHSKKEHWLAWLSEYRGPGAYGRKNGNRTAEFVITTSFVRPWSYGLAKPWVYRRTWQLRPNVLLWVQALLLAVSVQR